MNSNLRYLNDISNFIFINDDLEEADIIFIPGGSYPEIAEEAAKLWKKGYSNLILPSGAYGINIGAFIKPSSKKDIYNKNYKTEWEFLKDVLVINGVKEECILKEDKATFTYENAIFSKKVTDSLGIEIKKAIICCKSFHARRCLMYYTYAFPETEFIVCPTDVDGISKDTWHLYPHATKRVMSELRKAGGQLCDEMDEYLGHR